MNVFNKNETKKVQSISSQWQIFQEKKTVLDSDGAKFMGKPGSIVVESVILLICNRLSCYVFF